MSERFTDLGDYVVYRGTQSLLTIVPSAVKKSYDLQPGDKVKIFITNDGWLVVPQKPKPKKSS